MTEYVPGGRRRIDRVLAPDFLQGLGELTLDELRVRRADADQEEVDLSYARRLIQGRIDILRAEKAGRAGGVHLGAGTRSDSEIVEALAAILADERRESHGLGRFLGVAPSRVGEHRREAERAVADVAASDTEHLDDDDLATALESLGDIERRISRSRRQVQAVVDSLTEEVAHRYQRGEASMADHS
jgi:hypothetical protein